MLKCKNVLIKRTEVCLYAVSKSSKWKKVQATDFSQLTRNINQAKTYYLKQPKITFCKTCSTSNCVFHSSVMEECKSLLKQCLDDAFASDRTTHYSSLVSSKTIKRFCQNYSQLDEISKRLLLLFLCQEYSVKHSKVASASELFLKNLHHKRDYATLMQAEERLRVHLLPTYVHLFKLIGRLDNGVKFLTNMRLDAIMLAEAEKDGNITKTLRQFSEQLRATLSFWFSVGLLQLKRVTWETPADILEKVGKNEAVHTVRSWIDLKHRLGADRRCYVFIHSSMPREPLVCLHVALMDRIADNIKAIVDYTRKARESVPAPDLVNPSTAIFYSITSTQRGLQGIDFGVHMIRGVVSELRQEFSSLQQFSSLSPIPQFRKWLVQRLAEADHPTAVFLPCEVARLVEGLKVSEADLHGELTKLFGGSNKWLTDQGLVDVLKDPLVRLCAVYLYSVKRRGYAYDPVANFHLRNGATLWRLNWLGDTTAKGCNQSFGIMVNYRYYLEHMEERSTTYVLEKRLSASSQVLQLLDGNSTATSSKL